jgi:hypothetical protein
MGAGSNEHGNVPYISNEPGNFLTSCMTVSFSMALLLHYSNCGQGAG